jgi:hypothetical protein
MSQLGMMNILRFSTPLAAILVGSLISTASAQRSGVQSTVPDRIDPDARYVFYLHGRIVETRGRRPTHPEYGVYEYDRILEVLAADGVAVISEERSADADIVTYSRKVTAQIERLVTAGAAADRITVVGFSKGGIIAIAVSSLVANEQIRYVLLGACSRFVFDDTEFRLTGRVLSIYEGSDSVGVSCEPLFKRSPAAAVLEEIRIDTGYRHGAFYEPRADWLVPTRRWIGGAP